MNFPTHIAPPSFSALLPIKVQLLNLIESSLGWRLNAPPWLAVLLMNVTFSKKALIHSLIKTAPPPKVLSDDTGPKPLAVLFINVTLITLTPLGLVAPVPGFLVDK